MTQTIELALRRLRATPGTTALVVTSLACGIGLNILIFAFTSPALLKPLPYPDADRLVEIGMAPPDTPEARGPLTPPLYFLLRDSTTDAFAAVGVFDAGLPANLSGDAGGPAQRLNGHRITSTGLAALGATPPLGTLPTTADESGDTPTMLLSHAVWEQRFGGRADVVNETVQVDGQPTTILGVMPEGFGLLDNSSDFWFPSSFEPSSPAEERQHSLRGIGRLNPGVSIAQAQTAVDAVLDEYAQTYPDRDQGWTVELAPWREARFGGLRQPLTMVQLAVGGLLLLLCINLAVLLSARAASRERAPGPTGSRAVLTESLLLSFGGAVIGAVVTALGLPALRALAPTLLPRLNEVTFGAGVFAFAVVLAVVTGLVVAIVAAAWPSRRDATSATASWGGRLGAVLLVVLLAVQVAVAFVLLTGTGLGTRSVADLRGRDLGVDTSQLLSLNVYLPRDPYMTPNAGQAGSVELAEYNPAGPALYDRIRPALQAMPDVVQAAGVGTPPFAAAPFVRLWLDDEVQIPPFMVTAQYLSVTENYFRTMGIPILSGRDFSPDDERDSPWVVLVNEAMAREYWPDEDPIGHRVTLSSHPNDAEPAREVIGVVADTLPFRSASEASPLIYVLHRQQASLQRASFDERRLVMSFVLRTTGDPLAIGPAARETVAEVDVTTPVAAIRTVESYANAGQGALLQFAATLLGLVAIAALVTVGVGIYGLTAWGVAERRTWITLALRTAAAVAGGVVVGRVVWLRLGETIASFLSNLTVTPSDPATLLVAAGVIVATAFVACLVPALRPTRAR